MKHHVETGTIANIHMYLKILSNKKIFKNYNNLFLTNKLKAEVRFTPKYCQINKFDNAYFYHFK